MTTQELYRHFIVECALTKEWPTTYEVDAETYANCCQEIFNNAIENFHLNDIQFVDAHFIMYIIALGKVKSGIMFKGVELIYKPK